ncbi:MAG: hypothetical protein ACPG4X_20370 [Pikeienuella sp.]
MGANETAQRCRRYYNGDQLSTEEHAELAKRGQPPIVINRIRKEVNWMRGYEMQSKVDPRAFPRNPQDEELAGAATDALRFVADSTKYDKIRSKVWEGLVIEGTAGVEVIHKFQPPMKEPKIIINRYPFSRLFSDPHSNEDDYSDARYKGVVIWSDMDQLIEENPDKEDVIEGSIGPIDVSSDVYEDRPAHLVWSDPSRRRCRVVLLHYRESGQWKWAKFTKGGVLDEGESPYHDEDGESLCPLVMQSMYVDDDDNSRHGVVKDYLDPQDEVNKRRSKLLHQLNSRQTWGPKGAVASTAAMKRELAKPDGHVEVTDESVMNARESGVSPFNIIPTTDQAMGQMRLLEESKADIDTMGANGALMGTKASSSGRQVMAEQQGGLVEIAPIYGQLLHFDDEIYRQMWMRIRQLWTAEKWIRVTDDDKKARFVGLNREVTLQEELGQYSQEEVAFWAQQNGIVPDDPRLQQVVRIENPVATMDVDIIIDDVPDAVTLQGETFEQLVNLATSMPGSVPNEILIEAAPNLDRDVKDKLLERLEMQAQQQQEAAAPQQEMQSAAFDVEMQEKQSKTALNMANAQKSAADAQRSAMGY